MTFYTDSSHYRFALGNEMLKVLSYLKQDDLLSSDWWNSINYNNIDQHLENLDLGRRNFVKKNPTIVKEIKKTSGSNSCIQKKINV